MEASPGFVGLLDLHPNWGSGVAMKFIVTSRCPPSLREGSGTPKSSVGKVRILLKACDRTKTRIQRLGGELLAGLGLRPVADT